jgi:MFS family permease
MVPILVPTLLYAVGVGAILPVIPMIASRLGEPLSLDPSTVLAIAGVVAAMLMIGELVGNIPSGWFVSRIGERNSMIAASLLAIVGLVISMLSTTPLALGIGVFLVGIATAVFGLARHAFITTHVPVSHRARALATIGGLFRFGYFVGPFITVAVLTFFLSLEAAFWIHIVTCAASAVVLVFAKDPETVMRSRTGEVPPASDGQLLAKQQTLGLFRTIASRGDVLLRLGTGAAIISALRAGRIVVLPLWAVSISLDEVTTAMIIGVAGCVDFALFYLGGWLMDRYGRMWNALPSTLGLAVGFFMLALTHELPDATFWFVTVAMFLSLANGLGSGILLTIGSDLADQGAPAPFLGAWRFTGSLGNAAAPLAIAGATAVVSLPFAVAALGVVGIIGTGLLARYIPRYVPWGKTNTRIR